jgi:hypothetical protein
MWFFQKKWPVRIASELAENEDVAGGDVGYMVRSLLGLMCARRLGI